MKWWNKTTKADFGQVILTWRHRDAGRFVGKIFSWLLGAFVFGILTSIFFAAIQLPDIALPAARGVFFIVFIVGLLNDLFRAILNGYEYMITQRAIVYSHPFYGWERVGALLASADRPFRQTYYYFYWQDVKEIRELEHGILLVHRNENEIEVPVQNVIKLVMNLNLNKPELKAKGSTKSDKQAYDKTVLRLVLQAARDARRAVVDAKADQR